MELKKLKVYQISRELSRIGWDVYKALQREYRFLVGQQFVSAVDLISQRDMGDTIILIQ